MSGWAPVSWRGQIAAGVVAAVLAAAGCCGDKAHSPDGTSVLNRGPAPTYSEVASRYNARVEPLVSLLADTTVRFKYKDDNGDQHEDQGEGQLQVVRPDRVALSITKVGKRLFWFGGNAERYWWFDLQADVKTASVGRHDHFREAVANGGIGLAIEPLDLMNVVGMMPLPGSPGTQDRGGASGAGDVPGEVAWSKDGKSLVVTAPLRQWGKQRLWLDPTTLEPSRVELLDPGGKTELAAVLGDYAHMEIPGRGTVSPRLPKRIQADHLPSGTSITLNLGDPIQVGSRKISPQAFEFDTLVKLLGVDRVIDLDAPRAAGERVGVAGG